MTALTLRPAQECRYDAVSLGEVMLRLDPGEGRIRTARSFAVWEGGGEYNVVRGLSRVFGLRTGALTGLVDNEVGHLIEGLMLAGGVDTSLIHWVASDGIGRTSRNGLNFTERGFGVRGAVGVSDRGHTAAGQLVAADLDLDHLFGTLGVRWLHTGGIFPGLSATTAQTAVDVIRAARAHGTVVSYDTNYRPSLWQDCGGLDRAREVNAALVPLADVLIGSEWDLPIGAGIAVPTAAEGDRAARERALGAGMERVALAYPHLAVVARTVRRVHTASRNDWGALAWSRARGLVWSTRRDDLDILDRVGGGDAFASGLIYGLMTGRDLPTALEYGAAHGALAVTTPGDMSMASLSEVRALAEGGDACVAR